MDDQTPLTPTEPGHDHEVEPDVRFTYANERTFLAWNRTALAIIATGVVVTMFGDANGYADGVGTAAAFNRPWGLAMHPGGQFLYVADYNNNRIRRVDLVSQRVTTVAGSGVSAPGVESAAGGSPQARSARRIIAPPWSPRARRGRTPTNPRRRRRAPRPPRSRWRSRCSPL